METLFTPTLADAFARAGLPFPGEPEPGRLLRFSTTPKRRDDKAGWLRLFPDGDGAAFGCWRGGESFSWQRSEENAPPPSESERAAIRAKAESLRREAEAEREREYQTAAEQARTIWEAAKPLPSDFAYLNEKGIKPHLARLAPDGRMMVPVRGPDREIQSLQFIAADGEKRFHPGGRMAGGWCLLGAVRPDGPVLLAEGFATAASLREATGFPVFIAFTAGNLGAIAAKLKEWHADHPRLICGDDDRATPGNPGRLKASAAADATGAMLVFPRFAPGRAGTDFNDMHQAEGAEAVHQVIDEALSEPIRFKLLSVDDLAELPSLRWLVRGVLPDSGIGAIYGPSGSGKSFLALDLLAAIAEGRTWFDCPVNTAPVLYVALEGEMGIKQRVKAYEARYGRMAKIFRFLLLPLDIRNASDRAKLVRDIKAQGWNGGVLVLDTLNRAAPGMDENDSKEMGLAIAATKAIQAEIGGLVLLVHHTGKDATKGLRGHSSLRAALDVVLEVTRQDERREWKLEKAKDGEDGKVHAFHLDVVELGDDAEGWPVTSCVVVPEETPADAIRKAAPPGGGNQRIAWDALGELLKASRHFGQGKAPPSRPCLTLAEALDGIAPRLPIEPKRQRERAQQAITGLIGRGCVNFQEGWLWLP